MGEKPTSRTWIANNLGRRVAGKYVLINELGSGAMGAVYEARHEITGQRLALKLIHPSIGRREAGEVRFQREASIAAKVGHPGIVQVYDAGADGEDGTLFIAMELLEGETLKSRVKSGRSTVHEAVTLIYELLAPLAAAHEHGVIHRDLKPDNVFIADSPLGGDQVKILDFGIARELQSASATRTETGLGTPYYMAPEQATNAKSVTAAADVWAVGVMLYWIVSGRLPYMGEGPYEIVLQVVTGQHSPITEIVPDVDPELGALIETCLRKEASERYQDASELREALGHVLSRPEVLGSDSTMPFERREPWDESRRSHGEEIAVTTPIPQDQMASLSRSRSMGASRSMPVQPAPIASAAVVAPSRSRAPVIALGIGLLAISGLVAAILIKQQTPEDLPIQAAPQPVEQPVKATPDPEPAPLKIPVVEAPPPPAAAEPAPAAAVPVVETKPKTRPKRREAAPVAPVEEPKPAEPIAAEPVKAEPPPAPVVETAPPPPPPAPVAETKPAAPQPTEPVKAEPKPAPVEAKKKKTKRPPFATF